MKRGGLHLLALAMVALLLSACSLTSGRYTLLVSQQKDRTFPTNLQGLTVNGNMYAFVDPAAGVRDVLYFIDNEGATGAATGVDKSAPFDLAGGSDNAANPYDTLQLTNGRHTLTALVTLKAGGIVKVTAAFNVRNIMDPAKYSVQVSKLSDRSFPSKLDGQTVGQDIYAFVAPAIGVQAVSFLVDNGDAPSAAATADNAPPFDLAGGPDYAAKAFDTRQLSDGPHTVTAVVTHNTGGTFRRTASFDVRNKTMPESPIYWGVTLPNVPWDMKALTDWEAKVGKNPSIVHYWVPWTQEGTLYPFQPSLLDAVRGHGAIPMISWLPARASQGKDQPDYRLAAIAGGTYDTFIHDWAQGARDWGQPFLLRWAHEMNGDWYAWGEAANGNQPGDYVKAWRHIVDIFRQEGADNVSWVWCPNIDWSGSGWPKMQELYPGDNYVDWTCLDGYNWGADQGGWKDFNEVFRWSYEYIRSFAPAKPMILGEFGSAEKGGSKAQWIVDTFATQLPFNFPGIKAVNWYNVNADQDWRVESSPESLAAFKNAIASPYYLTNSFGDLSTSPVPP